MELTPIVGRVLALFRAQAAKSTGPTPPADLVLAPRPDDHSVGSDYAERPFSFASWLETHPLIARVRR